VGIINDELWIWGFRGSGQQGNGANVGNNLPPAPVNLDGKTVLSVAGGAYHLIALTRDGTVYGWGHNGYGQTGTGSSMGAPVLTAGVVMRNAVQVAAGEYCNIALDRHGDVWTWGSNYYGMLGNGENGPYARFHRNAPINISKSPHNPNLLRGKKVRLIGGSYEGAFAITECGEAYGWGRNVSQGFGVPNTPATAPDGIINTPGRMLELEKWLRDRGMTTDAIIYIGGGYRFGHALLADGRVIGWGRRDRLGVGSRNFQNNNFTIEPVRIPIEVNVGGQVRHVDGQPGSPRVIQLFSRFLGSVALVEVTPTDRRIFTWGHTYYDERYQNTLAQIVYGEHPRDRTPPVDTHGIIVEVGGGKEHIFYKTKTLANLNNPSSNFRIYGVGYNAGSQLRGVGLPRPAHWHGNLIYDPERAAPLNPWLN